MKKYFIYVSLFLLLLFFFYGKDFICSYLINKDFNLTKNLVLTDEYERIKYEYNELLEQNNLIDSFKNDGIITKVIIHDPYVFFDEVTILKGQNDGIKKGDVVVNEQGLVGEVTKVLANSSEVKLLTNTSISFSVKVQNSYGILKASGNQLIISNIVSKEEIAKDSLVYTSNFTNIPGEILVGKVVEVTKDELEQKVVVEPAIDLFNLNYVVVRKAVNYE